MRVFDTYDVIVEETIDLTPRVKGIKFKIPAGKTLHFKAGQFVQIHIPQPEKPRRTSYSIASSSQYENFFELCVTLVQGGISSPFLHGLKVGQTIPMTGPLGKFILPDPILRDAVFIATGSGIAPFRSMIQEMIFKKLPQQIYLIYGNRFTDDIIYKNEWDQLQLSNPKFHVEYTLSKPDSTWKGEQGYVQDKIQNFIPQPAAKDYYICGLVKMIDAVVEKLTSLGVPKEQIHFERFD
ncbi:MAG: ferredoxin--NADP reductase [Elusimicrobiota bacterium]